MRWAGILMILTALGCAEAHEAEETGISELERTSTPVLLLPDRYMEAADVIAEDRWYAIDYEDETISIHVHGTVAFVAPPPDLDLNNLDYNIQVRGYDGFDSLEEEIRTVAWIENGAAYTIEVICRNPIDQRCTSGAFAADVAAEMEVGR